MMRRIIVASLLLLVSRVALSSVIPLSQTLHVTASALSSGATVTDTPPDLILGNDTGQHTALASATLSAAYGKASIRTTVTQGNNTLVVDLMTDESHPFNANSNGSGAGNGTVSFMLDSPITWQVTNFSTGSLFQSASLKLLDHTTSSVVYNATSGNRTITVGPGQYDLTFSMQSFYAGGTGGSVTTTTGFVETPEPICVATVLLGALMLVRRRRPLRA
jgi:hypothetical protein